MAYAKAINKRYERSGPLFQGPFKSILVDQDAYLLHLSRYIHLNPVQAGFLEDLREWEFSSYHEYVGLRDGTLPKMDSIQGDFEQAKAILGKPPESPTPITCGHNGKPYYFGGPYDDYQAIMQQLTETVGKGNFEFTMPLG